MEKYSHLTRKACGIWLLVFCMLSFPWGLVYAAPVLLAYAVTWRKDWCSQVGVAAGCVSLLFTGYFLIRFACWKAAGNYDDQESIGLVFLLFYQTAISLIAMVLTWCFCAGYRNLSAPYEKRR